jgi:hypothetical protein
MAKLKETSVAGNLTVTGEVDATTGFRWGGQSLDERYDNRYINASGDTMTGNLVIASAATLTIDKGANFDWLGTTISSVIDLDDYNSTVMLNNYNAGSNFTNRPTGTDYGSVIAFGGGYANISLQLFNDINHSNSDGSELYFRALNGTGWHTWSKILTDLNFDSVTGGPYLPLTGGTLTGALVLPGDPGADDEAARKKYVDDEVSNHTHLEIDITDLDKYTQNEIDSSQATQDNRLTTLEADTHPGRTDNPHGVTAVQVDAYTQSQVDSLISGIDVGGVSTDSNNLAELGTDSKIWVPSTKVPIPVWEKNFNDETFTSYEFLGIEPNHDYKLIVSGFVGDTNFATDLNLQFITANGLEDSTKYRFMTLMAGSGPGNNEVYSGYYSSQDHFLLMKLAYSFGCAGEFLVGLSQNMIKSSAINGQSSSWETGGGYHTLTIGGFYIDSLGTLPVTGLRLSRGTTTSTTVKTGRLQWIRMPRM